MSDNTREVERWALDVADGIGPFTAAGSIKPWFDLKRLVAMAIQSAHARGRTEGEAQQLDLAALLDEVASELRKYHGTHADGICLTCQTLTRIAAARAGAGEKEGA